MRQQFIIPMLIQFFVVVTTLLAVVGVPVLIIHGVRQRRRINRAGVSRHQPGCPKCLYPVRGWSRSVCPECGTDVAIHGVVTGPRVSLGLKLLVAWSVASGLTAIASMTAVGWLFAEASHHLDWRVRSVQQPVYPVEITSEIEWRRFPPKREATTTVTIASRLDRKVYEFDSASRRWVPKIEPGQHVAAAKRTLRVGASDPLPSTESIARLLSDVLAVEPNQLIAKQAEDLAAHIAAQRRGGSNSTSFSPGPNAAFSFHSGGQGSGGGTGMGGAAMLLALGVAVAVGSAAVVIVRRRHDPAWRPVVIGAWAQ